LIAFLWGIQGVAYKSVSDGIKYKTVMATSWLLYSVVMILFICKERTELSEDMAKFTCFDIFMLIIASVLTGFLANYLYYYLMAHNDSHVVSSVTCISPLFTLLFAYLLLEEKITTYNVAGTIFIIIGVLLYTI
jgi:drug/metabolite transporter (DMT)-like permease